MASYAERRKQLKAGILADLSEVVVQEPWGSWSDQADELGLSEKTLASVMDEICSELYRRAQRLESTS